MNLSAFLSSCQENLFGKEKRAKLALDYLVDERGLSRASIGNFGIGYCSENQKVPGEDTWSQPVKIGRENENMKGKLVVPVYSEFGGLVAMLARSPEKDIKGWWNTKFDKANHLFLFNLARKHMFAEDKVYLVEGAMDAIVLRQEGLLNACGMMGVGLGYRRIGLLKRYCNNVCLCFDSDANNAGQKARDKSVFELSEFNFGSISIVNLPTGIDPDEYVLKNCLNEFLELEAKLSAKEIRQIRKRHLQHTENK